ncbi:MAG: iduronate-2-sulfatase [Opitutus sp.]|nr:iduronate-2-sulfatase [Opitutus sp.]
MKLTPHRSMHPGRCSLQVSNRCRQFRAGLAAWIALLLLTVTAHAAPAARPNVLFIAIDDLNDWTGCLGGHPQARTPNLDRLAASATLFTNTQCPAPWCNPSRTALLTGLRPSTTGIYHHQHIPWRKAELLKDAVTLPQYFRQHGYGVTGAGKVFHHANEAQDPASWDSYWPSQERCMPRDKPPAGKRPFCGAIIRDGEVDWAPLDRPKEEMADWQVAEHIAAQLKQPHDRPFFLACGFFRPHLPWFAPREYFDQFPLDQIVLPQVKLDDLDDVSPAARTAVRAGGAFAEVQKAGLWRNAVQAYLACTTFADDCLGHVLRTLDESPYAKNTIVVLWSDNGWHFGEKEHWEKVALWERATKCVLVVRAPGLAPGRAHAPVNLLDLYPTLLELAGLPAKPGLEGDSLVPWLREPSRVRARPSLSTFGPNNHALRSERWHFIRYANGDEELYDHWSDPNEWVNVAAQLQFAPVKAELAPWFPQTNAAPLYAASAMKTGRDSLIYLIGSPQQVK